MARKSSKNASKSTTADWYDRVAATLRTSTETLSFVTMCLCILGSVAVLYVMIPKLRGYLEARSFVDDTQIRVSFTSSPAWFDQTCVRELTSLVANAVGDGSALDKTRLTTARQALAESGWFRSVDQVRLDSKGGFIVDATFRTPYAVVRQNGREYLVDDEGCVLPREWTQGQRPGNVHWTAIINVAAEVPGPRGKAWKGTDIAAGLALLRAIREHVPVGTAWEVLVDAIDVSRVDAAKELRIITARGGTVIWGRTPGDNSPAEIPTARKLAMLDTMYARSQAIDLGGNQVIDVRGDVVTLAPDPAAAKTEQLH